MPPKANDVQLRHIEDVSDNATDTADRVEAEHMKRVRRQIAAWILLGVFVVAVVGAVFFAFLWLYLHTERSCPITTTPASVTESPDNLLEEKFIEAKETDFHSPTTEPKTIASWADSKLPGDLRPLKYFVEVRPLLAETRFHGNVTLQFEVVNKTEEVLLHRHESLQVALASDLMCRNASDAWEVVEVTVATDSDIPHGYSITPLSPLTAKSVCQIKELQFEVSGPLTNSLKGFSRYSYRVASKTPPNFFFAFLLSPTYARRLMPCFDEARFRAPVTFVFKELAAKHAFGPKLVCAENDCRADIGDSVALTSTRLSFVFGNFETIQSTTHNGTKLLWLATRSKLPSEIKGNLLRVLADALDFAVEWFGRAPPFARIAVLEVPTFFRSAFSVHGLILLEVGVRLEKMEETERLLFREVAKLFIADSLEPADPTAQFLVDGLAEAVAQSRLQLDSVELALERVPLLHRALVFDSITASVPVYWTERETFDDVEFDPEEISSIKAAFVFLTVRYLMTPLAFRSGIRALLTDLHRQPVHPERFFTALTAHVPRDIQGPNGGQLDLWNAFEQTLRLRGFPVIMLAHDEVRAEAFIVNYFDKHELAGPVPLILRNHGKNENETKVYWVRVGDKVKVPSRRYIVDPECVQFVVVRSALHGYVMHPHTLLNQNLIAQGMRLSVSNELMAFAVRNDDHMLLLTELMEVSSYECTMHRAVKAIFRRCDRIAGHLLPDFFKVWLANTVHHCRVADLEQSALSSLTQSCTPENGFSLDLENLRQCTTLQCRGRFIDHTLVLTDVVTRFVGAHIRQFDVREVPVHCLRSRVALSEYVAVLLRDSFWGCSTLKLVFYDGKYLDEEVPAILEHLASGPEVRSLLAAYLRRHWHAVHSRLGDVRGALDLVLPLALHMPDEKERVFEPIPTASRALKHRLEAADNEAAFGRELQSVSSSGAIAYITKLCTEGSMLLDCDLVLKANFATDAPFNVTTADETDETQSATVIAESTTA